MDDRKDAKEWIIPSGAKFINEKGNVCDEPVFMTRSEANEVSELVKRRNGKIVSPVFKVPEQSKSSDEHNVNNTPKPESKEPYMASHSKTLQLKPFDNLKLNAPKVFEAASTAINSNEEGIKQSIQEIEKSTQRFVDSIVNPKGPRGGGDDDGAGGAAASAPPEKEKSLDEDLERQEILLVQEHKSNDGPDLDL